MHTLQQLSFSMVKSQISGNDLKEGMVVHFNRWPEDKKYGLVVKQVVSNMFHNTEAHEELAIFIPSTNEICVILDNNVYTHLGNYTWEQP